MIRELEINQARRSVFLSRFHAITYLMISLQLSAVSILIQNPYLLSLIALFVSILYLLSMSAINELGSAILLILSIIYGSVFSQSLFYPEAKTFTEFQINLGQIMTVSFSKEGALHGLIISIRILIPILFSFVLYKNVSLSQLIIIFQRLKLNPKIQCMIIMSIKMLPSLQNQFKEIVMVLEVKKFKSAYKNKLLFKHLFVIFPVIIVVMRQAKEIAETLAQRGFNTMPVKSISVSKKEKWIIQFSLALTSGLFFIKFMTFLYLSDIWVMKSLMPLYRFAMDSL